MNHYSSIEAVKLTGSWLTIGVFDGVHRGHQQIITQLTAGAHANGAPAVVLTFTPHPAIVLAAKDIPCLTTPDERAEILFGLGVDVVITLPFNRQVADRTAEDFMSALKARLGLCTLLIGYDFALGRGRAGNFARLSELGKTLGYKTVAIPAVESGGEIISSTLIRRQIADGAVALAAAKLGRPYAAQGPVVPGDGRGRTIGIHTANVDIPAVKALPANGVYACWAYSDGHKYPAVTNIGLRPTFTSGSAVPRVEAHLLDYSGDLYGKILRLDFVERLRSEQKFTSADALLAQIHADIDCARKLLR